MVEALAMETPVVSTRCGGPEEVLVDGDTGFLVPVKDPPALADAIVKVLGDEGLARRIGARGRAHMSGNFTVERYVRNVEKVILETIADS
jgi:glycosyltransferase involved in cell wall biosynthesis